jgi:hypothetical protein
MAKKPQTEFLSPLPSAPSSESPAAPPQLQGGGAEAAEGQAGAAGGAIGLGHRLLVAEAAGNQGRERHHALYPRPLARLHWSA